MKSGLGLAFFLPSAVFNLLQGLFVVSAFYNGETKSIPDNLFFYCQNNNEKAWSFLAQV